MKSVTIKNPATGEVLIKVSHKKDGFYYVTSSSEIIDFDCFIITKNNQRMTIPVRRK